MPGTTEDVYGTGGSFASYLSGYGLRVPAIAGITQPLLVPGSWLDFIAEDYGFNVGRWIYAREHYTGEVAAPWRIAAYLIRKKVGETIEAFEERVLLADYTPYFGAVVDTLAGMLISREDDTARTWGRTATGRASSRKGPLGDVKDPTTLLGKLWMDADGAHNSWPTLWQLLATELVSVHDAWILVDGGADGGKPTVKILQPESVSNWRYEDGVLVEAVVKEHVDVRTSVTDNPRQGWEAQWVRFTTEGWTRWHKVRRTESGGGTGNPQQDEVPEQIDEGFYHYVTRDGRPTLPMHQVRLPLKRNVGYLMARKVNAIFNKESERDHLLRFATFPLLVIVGNDTLFKNATDKLRQGARVIQGQPGNASHYFIAPSAEPATVLAGAIKEKIEAFYATAFREFASSVNSGRDRVTATEVLAQREVGLEAFLAVLASAVDNAENATLWFLEQTVFKNDRTKWGQAGVSRPRTFGPISPQEAINQLKARYIGAGPVPIGRTGRISAAKQIAEFDGLDVDDKEIGADVDASFITSQAQALVQLAPWMPDEVKAEIIAQFAEAYGYGDQAEVKKLALAQLTKPVPVPPPSPPGGGAGEAGAGGALPGSPGGEPSPPGAKAGAKQGAAATPVLSA